MAENLGKTIRILRRAKGLSITEMARGCRVSVPFLSLIEKGTREPSLKVLRQIAETLDVPSEALLLMALGPQGGLAAKKPASTEIAHAVQQLVDMESKLQSLLKKQEAPRAAQRNPPRAHRGRNGP